MIGNEYKKTISNTFWLYLMNIAKLVFPLLTLPYLTRVLSESCYGVVSYVKACMAYMQLIVDFGFILSGVKDVVKASENKEEVGLIAGHVFVAKIMLGLMIIAASLVIAFSIPILRDHVLYVALSAIAVALTGLLADFLFRGLEKMHLIAIVFVIMKGIATTFTFVFIHRDSDILLIPILDIVGTLVAVVITWIFIKKLGIRVRFTSFKRMFLMLKDSSVYFLSDVSTTAFTALNTVLIGIFIKDAEQIAYWSTALQLINAVISLYAPISNGIYPQMVKNKKLKIVFMATLVFLPIIIIGTVICFVFAKPILGLVFGSAYRASYKIFRMLCPLFILSFFSILYGWPTLGAIGKVKTATFTTITAAVAQVLGLVILIAINKFTLINIAILRCLSELLLMSMRMFFTFKNKKLFTVTAPPDKSKDSVADPVAEARRRAGVWRN